MCSPLFLSLEFGSSQHVNRANGIHHFDLARAIKPPRTGTAIVNLLESVGPECFEINLHLSRSTWRLCALLRWGSF